MERDLGFLDGWETTQIQRFYDEAPRTTSENFFHLVLKLIRRERAAELTVRNVRKLSPPKQKDMLHKACQSLNTKEWTAFQRKSATLFDRRVKVTDIQLKLPLSNRPVVRNGICRAIRDSL